MNFDEIIKNNKQNVKNVIKKITNEENEDLEQEVYLRVVKNSGNYKEKGSFKSWINTIARNISFDYLKSAKFRCEKLSDDNEIFNNIKGTHNPESQLIQKERQKQILDEINKLKPKLKEVIILTEFYDMSYEDCAKKLKCPIGTIKSRIFNAKKCLAEKLSNLL